MTTINNNKNLENSSFLSKNSVKKVLPYAAASSTSFGNDESWITPLKLNLISPAAKKFPISSTSLKAHEKCYFDSSSGLKISLVEGKKEIIIAFGPMGSGNTEVPFEKREEISQIQFKTGAFNLLGTNCDIYEQAAKFVEEFTKLKEFKDKKIVIVGQSLGGSLAQYAGLKNQLPTYCFNPIPLGRAQINKLKADKKTQDDKIVVISAQGDYATLLAENRLSKIAQWIIETPKLYGKKFTIPSAYHNLMETHTYFMGSLMNYLGYDIRAKIDSLPLHEICIAKNKEMFDLAITDIERSINDLLELRTFLNENSRGKFSNKLQSIKNNAPWIFNYLSFITWLANEGRDFGDTCYGEHRLLETPLILKKMTVNNIPILDMLIEHFNVLLFIQNAKKSFQPILEKTGQISQTLLSFPTIYQEKNDLKNALRSILHSMDPIKKTTAFDKEALNLLLELNEELQCKKDPSEKQKMIIKKISQDHPKLYCSMLLLLKQNMNQSILTMETLSQLINANPICLIQSL